MAVLGLLAGIMLSSCAAIDKAKDWLSPQAKPQGAVAQSGPPPAQSAPVSPKPRPPVRETHDAKEPEKVASIDPNNLVGLDPPAVEKLLGTPSNISRGDPSLIWTYASSGCSLQIVFYPDLKTSSFHALKIGGLDAGGDQVDTSRPCFRNILTMRNNGPG